MALASHSHAKRFFIDRIAEQVSTDEEWMLSFSESDPDFDADFDRVDAFEAVIPASGYVGKIAGLARRAYQADSAASPTASAYYKDAFDVLSKGDHYLLIMLQQGLGWAPPRMHPWWAFWR